MWCDEMVVLDHAPSDNSFEIALEIAGEDRGRVTILGDGNPKWDEMRHRQTMLEAARERGATHIAIVDADEIVTGNLLERHVYGERQPLIRRLIEAHPPGTCLQLPMYQLRGSLDRYHSNGIWGNRWLSVAFQDEPRLSWSGDKFHSREPEYPGGGKLRPYQPIKHGQGGSFHLWGVSERRLKAKHALYKCVERLRWPAKATVEIEREYNLWRSPADSPLLYLQMPAWGWPWTFADVPAEWWVPYEELLQKGFTHDVDWSDPPWQITEVRRLVAEHGAETFKGLDLFGVV